jgi:hypothetical protein
LSTKLDDGRSDPQPATASATAKARRMAREYTATVTRMDRRLAGCGARPLRCSSLTYRRIMPVRFVESRKRIDRLEDLRWQILRRQ